MESGTSWASRKNFLESGASWTTSVDPINDVPKNFRVQYRVLHGQEKGEATKTTKGRWAEAVAFKQFSPEMDDICNMVSMALDSEREELERRHRQLLQNVSDHMQRGSRFNSKTSCEEESRLQSKTSGFLNTKQRDMSKTCDSAWIEEAILEEPISLQPADLPGNPVREPAEADSKPTETKEDADLMAKKRKSQDQRISQVTRANKVKSPGDRQISVLGEDGANEGKLWYPSVLVQHPMFDALFCGVILANCVVMFFEFQYQGFETGFTIGYPKFEKNAEDTWPYAREAFHVIEWIFGVIFTAEILLKVAGQKLKFPCYLWNWIDTVIVVCWIMDAVASSSVTLPVDPTMMRLVRLARTLRLLRLMRTMKNFDALYIMTTAIYGSCSILSWCFVLLMMVQTCCAFVLNQLLQDTIMDVDGKLSDEHKQQIFKYFGTTWRALFTMFELTLGNWVVPARILQEHAGAAYCLFTVIFKLCIGFGVLGVVNGVFTQETFKVAAADNRIMMRQKEREVKHHTKKMKQLFSAADESGDGILDSEEFYAVMTHPETKLWLSAQDISFRDPHVLFDLIEDGKGQVTADALVMGVARLKGGAKQLDLITLQREQDLLWRKIAEKLGVD